MICSQMPYSDVETIPGMKLISKLMVLKFTMDNLMDNFWPEKNRTFDQKLNFLPKMEVLTKNQNFDQNSKVWPQFEILNNNGPFDQKWNFWPKMELLTKKLNFDQQLLIQICITKFQNFKNFFFETFQFVSKFGIFVFENLRYIFPRFLRKKIIELWKRYKNYMCSNGQYKDS